MGIDALRLLDRVLGVPLCWLFTVARRLVRLTQAENRLPAPRRVLIIKLSEMGSTVLAYPALNELKQRIPGVELFFLVFKNNAAIVDALSLVPAGNIITVDYGSPGRLLTSGLQAMRRLFNASIDTTIDMDFFSRLTTLTAFWVCRGNRVGFHRYTDEGLYRGDLLTHQVLYSPHIHASAAFMALIQTLFEKPDDEPYYRGRIDPNELALPRYTPSSQDVKSVWEKLEAAGVRRADGGVVLLINPNSSDIFPLRKWPLPYFAELCKSLLQEVPDCALVVTGVATERADARYILEHVQNSRCVDFTGKTSFGELLALYSIAAMMITNDSGPAHFASLLALPTIVLFGPETPRLYGPLGTRHRDLYADFVCSPCVSVYNGKKSACTENRCLKSILPEQVLREALALLGNHPSEAEKPEPK